MIAVDTNVLVYAHRAECPLHATALGRLKRLAAGAALWGVPAFCLPEFVRVVTHARIFTPPSTIAQALEFLDALLQSESLRILSPADRFVPLFRQELEESEARGNLAHDAAIAAVCLEHGARRILTADRDFARFRSIEAEFLRPPPHE